jgi:hypothetical protein
MSVPYTCLQQQGQKRFFLCLLQGGWDGPLMFFEAPSLQKRQQAFFATPFPNVNPKQGRYSHLEDQKKRTRNGRDHATTALVHVIEKKRRMWL